MKVSKSLLQAIALGVTMGLASTSCTKSQHLTDADILEADGTTQTDELPVHDSETVDRKSNSDTSHGGWDCPACGLG